MDQAETLYTILSIDDNQHNLFSLEALLDEVGQCRVLSALGASQALEILRDQPVDLILLDVQMPEVNGFDLARTLKANPLTADIPIIFLTAIFKSQEFVQQGYELGAVDYLTKPIDNHQLLNKVRLYLRLIEKEHQLRRINGRLEHQLEFNRTLMEAMPLPLFLKGVDGTYLDVNRAFENFVSRPREQLLGRTCREVITARWCKTCEDIDERLLSGQDERLSCEIPVDRGDGTWADVIFTKSRICSARDGFVGIVGALIDVTERNRALEETAAQKNLLESLLDATPDVIFIKDCEGNYLGCNTAFEALVERSRDDVLGKSDYDLFPARVADGFCQHDRQMLELGQALRKDELATYSDGRRVVFDTLKTPFYTESGSIRGLIGVARDVTDREQLRQHLEQLRFALDSSAEAVLIHDLDGRFLYANQAACTLYGYSHDDFLQNLRLWNLDRKFQPEQTRRELEAIRQKGYFSIEVENRKRHGSPFPAEVRVQNMRYGDQDLFLVFVRDLTAEKLARQNRRELLAKQTILEHMNDAILIHDVDGRILEVNENMLNMYAVRAEEALHYDIARDYSAQDNDFHRLPELWREVVGGAIRRFEWHARRPHDGVTFYVEVILRKIALGGKDVILASVRDISEQKQLRDDMLASLKEKEMLLKEVHHRVKNNMQIVSSLLNLQTLYSADDQRVVEVLDECQGRIRSMALIHEKLYQSDTLARIDFKNYIKSLSQNLFRAYRANSGKIQLNVDVHETSFGINTAIPLGLILNELISNALKHAFIGREQGVLRIVLQQQSTGRYILEVDDDGVGFPAGFEQRSQSSLGMELIHTLADQLNGSIRVGDSALGGGRVEVEFGDV